MNLDRLSGDVCDRATATCGFVAQFRVEIVGELHRGALHDMPAYLLQQHTSTRGLNTSRDHESQQPRFQRLQHRPRSIAHAELRQDARDLILDRSLGGAEGVGDLFVAVAAGH